MLARKRLRAFREHLGLSQQAMAELLKCDQSYVGLVERGKRKPGGTFTHRLEALSKDWDQGAILREHWLSAADLDVPQLPNTGEARR